MTAKTAVAAAARIVLAVDAPPAWHRLSNQRRKWSSTPALKREMIRSFWEEQRQ
jgi:hypothetical protein